MSTSNFSKLFRQSLINLTIIIFGASLVDWAFMGEDFSNYRALKVLFVGGLLLYAEIMCVVGFVKLIRRRKEGKDYKYYVALVINGLITSLLIISIFNLIRNLPGMYQAMS